MADSKTDDVKKDNQDDNTKNQASTKIEKFKVGDTISVNVRIIEGSKERQQAFQGVAIAIKNKGESKTFTVRKISNGVGVERIFPYSSPRIESVKVVRYGIVRRSKLYYLRGKSGKQARIEERIVKQPKKKKAATV